MKNRTKRTLLQAATAVAAICAAAVILLPAATMAGPARIGFVSAAIDMASPSDPDIAISSIRIR